MNGRDIIESKISVDGFEEKCIDRVAKRIRAIDSKIDQEKNRF